MPPTPKKRGRRRLTALEVLQAKSAFCRSQSIFLRLACSWKRFEGSAEATKGAPVPPIGGLTVLRIPSKKGKAGMLLDLGTRVGWRARGDGGGGHQRAVWEQQGVHWLDFLGSLKNLTGDEWGAGGGVGRVGQGGGQGGEMGGGGTREQCGSNKEWTGSTFSLKKITIGLIWLVTRRG